MLPHASSIIYHILKCLLLPSFILKQAEDYKDVLEDVGCNADLYIANQDLESRINQELIKNQEDTNLLREMYTGDAPFTLA